MTKIVAVADAHVDATTQGYWDAELKMHSNWYEALQRIKDTVELCNTVKADLLAIGGDLFDKGTPPPEIVALLFDLFRTLETAKVIYTDGNHDQSGIISNHRTPAAAYMTDQPWCYHVSSYSEVIDFEGLQIAMTPWHRVAGTKSLEATSNVLYDDIKKMADQISGPSILLGHLTVDEASFGSSMRSTELMMSTSVLEASVPTLIVEEGPWSVALLGHIHKKQELGSKSLYLGSTYKVSFSEEKEQKGAHVIDIDESGNATWEFVPFNVRELVSLDLASSSNLLSSTADILKPRDIFRIMLPHDDEPTSKAKKIIEDLRSRGVEVQVRHHPKERTDAPRRSIAIDTSPVRAMELYANDTLGDDPVKMKRNLDTFKDIYNACSQ